MDSPGQPPSPSDPVGPVGPAGVRLRLSAFLAFVLCAFGLLLAGPLAWYNYSRSTEAAVEVAAEAMARAASNVSLRTRLLAQPLALLADQMPALPGARIPPRSLDHPMLPALLQALESTPQIYSAYLGYPDGSFLQAISVAGKSAVAASLGAPEGTILAVRGIWPAGPGMQRLERWRFLGPGHARLGEKPPVPAQYDPRPRPWHALALKSDATVRTDLYVFNSTGELGLTLARRLQAGSRESAVFGVDLTLPDLCGFLAQARLGKGGLAFLYDADGQVLGHPDPAKLARAGKADGSGAAGLAKVDGLDDPVARAVHGAFLEAGGGRLPLRRLSIGGADYLVEVRQLHDLKGEGDFLALAARVEDFTGAVARTRNNTLLFTLALSLALIPLATLGAQRLAAKLTLLAREADRIRSLDLDAGQNRCANGELRSHIDEMDRLAVAVSGMRSAICSFSRYLPRALVRQFIDTGVNPELGGERREITLLFTDVENFTPLAEHMPPEELMAAMGEYFETVGKAILDCGGTIDKYIGDAVMAFWNAPFESEAHVEQACVAALRLSKASEELNRRREQAGLPLLRTRVGVHTGTAVVGNIGASDRMDYTALGANVNLASRLEGLNKFYATRILVSRTVRERAKSAFLFRSVDVVVPKGASEPLIVFELVGAMPQSPHADVAAPRARLAFCSRWERAVTLYRTAQWERALAEFEALALADPEDRLAAMYRTRAARLLENKPGRDWKAITRYMRK